MPRTSVTILRRFARIACAIGLLLTIPAAASADPGDVGFEGPPSPGSSPSGSKPESKLWFNDGFWWGILREDVTSDLYIWKLNQTTDTWTRTNTVTDTRSSTRADVLWDGTKLYVATHQFSENDGAGTSRLYRLSYNASTDTYTNDSGYPKTINSVKSETLVIAKDSTGKLWATWEANGRIWVNRTTGTGTTWSTTPFALPGAAAVNIDDISSIIAFGGNRIGIFWSNQNASPGTDFFAVHTDGTTDNTGWAIETAYSGTGLADDHVNLKTDSSGRVYSVVKTSLDNAGSSPYIVLLARQTSGTWSNHTVSVSSQNQTRPILEIDETNNLLRVFATSNNAGGTINQHTSAISPISFPGGAGTVVIKDASALDINNASSTKQNITSATGLIVLAYNDTTNRYWHADILGGGPPPDTTAPVRTTTTVNGSSLVINYDEPLNTSSTPASSAFDVQVNSVARGVSTVGVAGSAVTLTLATPVISTDTVTVAYTMPVSNPIEDVAGNDAATFSAVAVTNNTPPPGGGGTFTFIASEDAQVKSTSAGTNYGNLPTMQLREEAAPGVTYRDYLKFNLTGLTGTVSSVKLRLWITDTSTDSGTVYGTSTGWSEGLITWSGPNAAPALGTSFGSAGDTTSPPAPPNSRWIEITLNPSSVGSPDVNGNVAFGLKTTNTNSSIFSSSEGTNPPELVVTTTSPADTTAPVFQSGTINGSALTLTYNEALDSGSVPTPTDLTISGRTLSNIAVGGTNVTATVTPAAVSTDTITVNYTAGSAPIQDVAGNDAGPLTNQAVTNTTPPADTTAPVFQSGTINGSALTLTYNEALDSASVPTPTDLTISGRTLSGIAVSGTNVTATVTPAAVSGDTITVNYTAGSAPIQDVAGNDAGPLTNQAVTNTTPAGDVTPPTPTTATVNGATLVINFNEALDAASAPAGSAFDVQVGGSRSVTNVAISGSSVTLTLNPAVVSTDAVTVAYTKPGSPPVIQDVAGNDAVSFSAMAVTNNTPPASGTSTFVATEDAQVKSTSPTTNYGSLATMQLREEPSGGTLPTYRDYLKFDVTSLTGTVSSVKLRLWITDTSPDSGTVYGTSTGWSEGLITWSGTNAAPALGTSFGSAGDTTSPPAPPNSRWIEITLSTSSVNSSMTLVSFGLKTTSTNSSIFESSEGGHPPELVVTTN
jgi:uncharacterized repeat protein (TIGR02059 family)